MVKYRHCPSIFAMLIFDSQHPPRSGHAVYLGEGGGGGGYSDIYICIRRLGSCFWL